MTARSEIHPAPRPPLEPQIGILHSGLVVGWISIALAVIGLFGLRETFHDELNYVED